MWKPQILTAIVGVVAICSLVIVLASDYVEVVCVAGVIGILELGKALAKPREE